METVDACIECAKIKSAADHGCRTSASAVYQSCQMVPIWLVVAAQAQTPVTLLLDHAYTEDVVKEAVSAGLNAVMYDISELSI